ncbi:MAG: gliding motility-associated C-terminal domain-containing protein, partial [Bacteroidota bacterium]
VLTDSILIQLLDYRVPNVFSPNGDEVNNVFKPFFLGQVDQVEVQVYNRWGQLIFESNDPNNPGWDGTKDDKPAPSDVYIYRVLVGLDGTTVEEKGNVTLVR